MKLSLSRSSQAPVVMLSLEGRLDWSTGSQVEVFAEQRRRALGKDAGLLLDLSGLAFCDSVGIGVLVTLAQSEKDAGREMVVCGLRPAVRRVLEAVRLHDWFLLFDDVQAGLRWLAPVASGDAYPAGVH